MYGIMRSDRFSIHNLKMRNRELLPSSCYIPFSQNFKHTTGLPPHTYLLQMRVELAKDAIEKGSSLADAAFQSGFADQSHMTRCFKAVYGLPPGQYKNAFFVKNSNFIQDLCFKIILNG